MVNISEIQLRRITRALRSNPTAAYTAPHDYPHGAPIFRNSPRMEREQIDSDVIRLYLHIPFCNYACAFCCYAKRVGVEREQMARYVSALKKELDWVRPGTRLNQFFMGGGTPTALPADLLDELLSAVTEHIPYDGTGVHTVETSPESMTDEHLEVLQRHGVGRVSMGIQSLQESVLQQVKRGHGEDLALDTCHRIIEAGLILNIDLIYGLPGQSHDDFTRDFQLVSGAGVHAITAYNLRLNERTSVQKSLREDERFDLQRLIDWRHVVRDTAADYGFTQTRWHTFKRLDSIAARHERLPVADRELRGYQLGVGMSARSSIGHTLYRNHSKLATYMERVETGFSPVEEYIPLNREDLKTQFIARTLGDGKGLNTEEYQQVFNSDMRVDFAGTVDELIAADLIHDGGGHIAMTDTGRLLYDLIMLSFYSDHAKAWLKSRLDGYQLLSM